MTYLQKRGLWLILGLSLVFLSLIVAVWPHSNEPPMVTQTATIVFPTPDLTAFASTSPVPTVASNDPRLVKRLVDDYETMRMLAANTTLTARYLNDPASKSEGAKYAAMQETYKKQVADLADRCAAYQLVWDEVKPEAPARECPTYEKVNP